MDYVEWVERVFNALMSLDDRAMGRTSLLAAAPLLGLGEPAWDDFASRKDPRLEGLMDAARDLAPAGIEMSNVAQVRITPVARDVAHTGFREEAWSAAFESPVDEVGMALLRALVDRSVEQHDQAARVVEYHLLDAWAATGADRDTFEAPMIAAAAAHALKDKGLLRGRWGGRDPLVWPTVFGVIRATRADDLEWQRLLTILVAEWETTSVELKRELDPGTDAGKRRLVRSALALANTKASGRRFLVIGYDPKSHVLAQSVHDGLTPDRIEDILAAYADPVPETRYRTVGVAGGTVGMVEILRNAEHLPYRARRAMKGIEIGDVLVRHGSHIEPPTAREMVDLVNEGRLARGEPVTDEPDE